MNLEVGSDGICLELVVVTVALGSSFKNSPFLLLAYDNFLSSATHPPYWYLQRLVAVGSYEKPSCDLEMPTNDSLQPRRALLMNA